jgi:cytoskeletal protein RodZ
MTSDSTTQARWPLLDERGPFAEAARRPRRRPKLSRPIWLLVGLAFLCGGLISAAGFSIGWRHQAQRDTAAQTALAAATARTHRLSASLAAARRTIAHERQSEAAAVATARAASRAAASLAAQAATAGRAADNVSVRAGDIAGTAARVSRELQTLLSYLTTTPAGQIDSGYVASQSAYLTRQLTTLQDSGSSVTRAGTIFQQSLRKLRRLAAELAKR